MKQTKKQKNKIIAVRENKYLVWVMFASFLVCVFFASSFKIGGDDDFFWHLATGRFIVENKYVPDSDPFGYATQGNKWIPFEWGWDVLTYSLFSVGNYSAILVFRSIVICLIFYLYILLFRKFNINPILSILLLFVLLIGSMDRLTPRPHLITYLFTVILLYLLFTFKYIDKKKNLRKLYALPLLFIIWCNFHMGVMIGITILLIFTFSEMLIYYKPSLSKNSELKPLDKEVLKKLIIITIVCLIALLINPHWYHTYLYAYSHSQMKMLEKIHEWQNPFSGKIDYNFIVTIYKVLLFSGFVVLIYAFKKKEPIHALIYIIFAIYSIRAIRFTVDYEIVIIFFIALSLQYFTGKFLQTNSAVSKAVNSNLLKGLFVVFFLYLTIQIQSDRIYHTIKYYRLSGYNIDENYSPVHIFNFIKDSGIKGVPFNSFECGGYFIWTLRDQKNFIDSRNLNDNIFDEYSRIYSMKQGFENDLERLNIDYFIYFDPELFLNPLKMKNTINGFLFKNKMWKLIYWDDRSLLFVKDIPRFAEVIEKYNYSVLNPYDMYYNKEIFESNIKNNPDTAKKELDRKASMEPEGFFYRNMAALLTKYLKPG